MAIELSLEGSREAVIRHIESWNGPEVKPGDPPSLTEEEKKQLPLLKTFLIEEIKNLDPAFNSVRLIAGGHCHKAHRHLAVDIVPRTLHL